MNEQQLEGKDWREEFREGQSILVSEKPAKRTRKGKLLQEHVGITSALSREWVLLPSDQISSEAHAEEIP